ncbi:MAG: type II secretion system F family protein [Actinomycetota bacterium]
MSAGTLLAPLAAAVACAAGIGGMHGCRRRLFGAEQSALDRGVRPRPRARGARARRRDVHGEVPQLLDLLAAGSTAGLSAELSFRRAVACLRGPLGVDLGDVLHAIDLGAPWRRALAAYADASGDPDLRRTVAVLARTETLGVPLTEATRELARSVREARRSGTLEHARTAPVKMLFPLVFLILPAFLLLTVVPVLITTIRSIE